MSDKLVALLIAAALPLGAQAATETWDLRTDPKSFDFHGHGNTLTVDGEGANDVDNDLRITGWSDTGNNHNDGSTRTDEVLQDGYLAYSSSYGLTLQNRDNFSGTNNSETSSPGHSIDNFGDWTDTDMVLLSFEESITLESFSIGWAYEGLGKNSSGHLQYGDGVGYQQADITVVGYTGNDTITGLAGNTWSDLASGAWTEVETFGNVAKNGTANLATSLSSKYWLIGAFNTAFSGSNDEFHEGFKLHSVTGSTSNGGGGGEVPLPSTVLLLIAGWLSLQASSKKRAYTAKSMSA